MSDTYWRSPVDLPRDGSVVAVIFTDERIQGVRCEALMFGVLDHDPAGPLDAWFCAGEWSGPFDFAKDLDPKIIGWHPLPQLAQWGAQ